jgi:hypothetical protein
MPAIEPLDKEWREEEPGTTELVKRGVEEVVVELPGEAAPNVGIGSYAHFSSSMQIPCAVRLLG